MPREEILLRMMSAEGAAIAQAIVFASDVARDRLARGIDPTQDPNPVLE